MKTLFGYFAITILVSLATSAFGQCVLTGGSKSQAQVTSCLNACGCSSIVIEDGVTVDMNGSWDLSSFGAITFTIQGSGVLAFSGNGGSADALTLASGSVLIIEDTDNSAALSNSGNPGQVRLTIGSSTYQGLDFDEIVAAGGADEAGTLPVELIFFSVSSDDKSVEVSWATASETNNDYFTVERSKDGVVYEEIATIQGAGNSIEKLAYDYLDNNPLVGQSYYRLRQTDFDGTTEVFAPKAVYHSKVRDLTVFPNPAGVTDMLTIQTGADADEDIELAIYSNAGQLVKSETVNGSGAVTIQNDLKAGFYMLQVKSGQVVISTRLVIQ